MKKKDFIKEMCNILRTHGYQVPCGSVAHQYSEEYDMSKCIEAKQEKKLDDIGNRDLQMVHSFLKELYGEYLETHEVISDEVRLKWCHAIQTVGSIGYQYRVERLTNDYVDAGFVSRSCRIVHDADKPDDDNRPADDGCTSTHVGWHDFGDALNFLLHGRKLTRVGWNGDDMYIMLQTPTKDSKMTKPYVYMKTADDELVPWIASQTDILADDWILYVD